MLRTADGLLASRATPAALPARRARRSSDNIGAAPMHRHADGGMADVNLTAVGVVAGAGFDAADSDGEDGEGLSPEAQAWAASLTGRLRGSLRALSRKFVRSLHTLAHRHPHAAGAAVGVTGDAPFTMSEELQYRLEQHAQALQQQHVQHEGRAQHHGRQH
jgi:hypothetical protein